MTLFRVNAGKYRHIITFQEKGTTNNEYGEVSTSDADWIDVYKTKAGIYPISGKEVMTAEFVNSDITHKIHIRFTQEVGLNSHMRIKYGNRIFAIISPPIDFQEKHVEFQILCKEVF